jgi:NAD(P)-dependent dehydrogenase (short-subunit alcohol dehydrogenase family)
MAALAGKVAIVAGASRGAGRGIARALGEAGATVYVVGRTTRANARQDVAGTVDETAAEVSARGGRGIAVRVDCSSEDEVAALFDRVRREHGRLDVLAASVWGGSDAYASAQEQMAAWGRPFWEDPAGLWTHMMDSGPRAYYLLAVQAARTMVPARSGLIAGVTDGVLEGADPAAYGGQLVWDLAHGCINRLVQGVGSELAPHGVAAVALMPGFMRTERVLAALATEEMKKMMRFDASESVEYLGRAVAALAADPQASRKSGRVHFVADLAREYGFTDVDGRQPPRFNPFG